MHELSIAQNILEIVRQHVPQEEWERVGAVRLKMGAGAGVVADSLKFSFEAIKTESSLSQAVLEIESVPFRVHCNVCNKTTENEAGFALCQECGSSDIKIISGLELNITEIEINEPEVELL